MWRGVKIQTPAAILPITVDKVKARLRVDHSDEDTEIGEWLIGAIRQIDGPNGIGFAMMEQTWRKTLDCFPDWEITLPGAPIKSVTSVNYIDNDGNAQVVNSANYRLATGIEPVRLTPSYGNTWPGTRAITGAVWVDYVLGESDAADVPPDLIDAVVMMVAHRYENREAVMSSMREAPLAYRMIVDEYRQSMSAA